MRNETNRGVFQAQEQQLQDHEPGAKVVGEETEVEGTYEMQESSEVGNVLVLENEENVETTTIEIQVCIPTRYFSWVLMSYDLNYFLGALSGF